MLKKAWAKSKWVQVFQDACGKVLNSLQLTFIYFSLLRYRRRHEAGKKGVIKVWHDESIDHHLKVIVAQPNVLDLPINWPPSKACIALSSLSRLRPNVWIQPDCCTRALPIEKTLKNKGSWRIRTKLNDLCFTRTALTVGFPFYNFTDTLLKGVQGRTLIKRINSNV